MWWECGVGVCDNMFSISQGDRQIVQQPLWANASCCPIVMRSCVTCGAGYAYNNKTAISKTNANKKMYLKK